MVLSTMGYHNYMKDQLEHWNHAHAEQWLRKHLVTQTAFVEEMNKLIPANSIILELGVSVNTASAYLTL